ncbi:MAG: methylamine utilization protein [Opitutaceae bacterium]|nr:methylamine utilization protein [Opitutaceae bacterium]
MRLSLPLIFVLVIGLSLRAETATISFQLHAQAGPLENAVASLMPLDFAPPPAADDGQTKVAQENKEYEPYVTAIRADTTVRFPNHDSVQHHIYSISKAKRFEKPLYASGASETVFFDHTGVVTLGCNIHDWMVAYIVVLPTPWFVKTGPDGTAALQGMPPGRYRLEVWHPRLAKPLSKEITLAAGSNPGETLDFKLKPDRRIRRAPSGTSGGY